MKKSDILKSFETKDTLCPYIWDGMEMKQEVREKLLKITEEFLTSIDEPFFIEDIRISGSLANYNWSDYSDIDLHVVIDFNQFDKNEKLYQELFDAKKKNFNEKYNFKIKNHEVEVYPQDINKKEYSSGVYSIMEEKWLEKPEKKDFKIDKEILNKKIKDWKNKIDAIVNKSNKEGLNKYRKDVKTLKEKLKKYRTSGLSKQGEFSYENLVFKYLRRSGYIGKLMDSLNAKKNKELSMEKYISEQMNVLANSQNSQLIKSLTGFMNLLGSKVHAKNKDSYNPNIENLQRALEFLGYDLPRHGANGLFNDETKLALDKFRGANGLQKSDYPSKEDIEKITQKLKEKGIKDLDLTKRNYQLPKNSGIFTYVDLNTPNGFELYKNICGKFIASRNPGSPITGDMMASSAKKYQYVGYVPPELACAQLALEGGLSTNPNVRPIKTKNPFNVGNTDVGRNRYFNSFQEGIDAYYRVMTKNYLPRGKRAEDLLRNFTNVAGQRYASSTKYEKTLNSIISKMKA